MTPNPTGAQQQAGLGAGTGSDALPKVLLAQTQARSGGAAAPEQRRMGQCTRLPQGRVEARTLSQTFLQLSGFQQG